MSRDYGELEREFIDGLADDTGRDLAAWMKLIDSRAFAHRNDMIDWLRQHGLTFAKASRLERIHHNGGKPLYGERPVPRLTEPAADPAVPAMARAVTEPPSSPPPENPAPAVTTPSPAPAEPPPTMRTAAADNAPTATELAAFLTRAKGYRPLAELLLRTIRDTIPDVEIRLADTHADFSAPALFGALSLTAKDVRLSLALGDHPFEGELKRLRLPGIDPLLTHTLVLSDARRIDGTLRQLIVTAVAAANTREKR